MQLFESRESTPVCYEKDGMKIRLAEYEDDYKFIVEASFEEIDTAKFKHLFVNLTEETPKFSKNTLLCKALAWEDDEFETAVSVMKFSFLSERAGINTQYNLFDYNGQKGTHLVMFSTKSNEKYMNEDYLKQAVPEHPHPRFVYVR